MSDVLARRSAGRPRSGATREAILAAAYKLLADKGLARFTIEGVAELAGSAKTTIYRWWPSKGALAAEAFLRQIEPLAPFPATGNTASDLRGAMHALARALSGPLGRIIADIVAEGQKDPDALQGFLDGYLKPRREIIRRGIMHGVETGQVRRSIDVDTACDALFSPIFAHTMFKRRLDDAWVDRLADATLGGILESGR